MNYIHAFIDFLRTFALCVNHIHHITHNRIINTIVTLISYTLHLLLMINTSVAICINKQLTVWMIEIHLLPHHQLSILAKMMTFFLSGQVVPYLWVCYETQACESITYIHSWIFDYSER